MNKDFIVGAVYFSLEFEDKEFKLPTITSLVFLGKNLEEEDAGCDLWYFQDPQSYFLAGPFNSIGIENPTKLYESENAKGQIYTYQEDLLEHILTVQELIEDLHKYDKGVLGAPPDNCA